MTQSDAAWQHLISSAHASGRKASLAITGGGSGAIGELLRIPGGSRLLVEAQVPYDEQALASYLGFAPSQAANTETAIALAQAARERSARMVPAGGDLVGLGATAALVSDRPRRGTHRFHLASVSSAGVAHCTAILAKGRRDRAGEEDLVSRAIVVWLARACGVAAPSPRDLLDPDEEFSETIISAGDGIGQLLGGGVSRVSVRPDGQVMLTAPSPPMVFPGSFNPIHDGHLTLARVAEALKQQPLTYEVSVTNVDKPPLSEDVVRQRLTQFAWRAPVELTRAPTFLEKSRLFQRTIFVIGADTAERLVAPRYYGDDTDRMFGALDEIGNAGNSFLVAVRADAAGRVRTLGDISMPTRYVELFTEIPEHRFRFDLSSSAIRASSQASGQS